LDQTIFYPIGGGQPSDTGSISNDHGKAQVTSVKYNKGLIEHFCHIEGELAVGDTVTLTIDWTARYRHMQLHTAGHVLDEAVKDITPEFHGIEGMHGINNQHYIEFNGFIDSGIKDDITAQINSYIQDNLPISSEMVTIKEIEQKHIVLPFSLPEDKPLRLITIDDHAPVPDGGTQLQSTSELWPVNLGEFEYKDGHTLIHYHLDEPLEKKTESIKTQVSQGTLSIKEFQQLAHDLKETAKANPNEDYLGKKGKFNDVAKLMKDIAPADRAEAGKLLNELKKNLEDLSEKSTHHEPRITNQDTTIPGITPDLGHLHLISEAIEEVEAIFNRLGFVRRRYPEIESDWYYAEGLNIPKDHPARDDQETFYFSDSVVLTAHTSNGQLREMELLKDPPIKMINIGKTYRRQASNTHSPMFHQFEGLVVDKGINMTHLVGVSNYFAKNYFGPDREIRLRPHHFQFTEPSFEVDINCHICKGKGEVGGHKCKVCKSGWLELGGAGMVHPNVLRNGGIDPDTYSGFAFGWGIERIIMMKHQVTDNLRLLYTDDLRFLTQS